MNNKNQFKGKFWDFIYKGKQRGKPNNQIKFDDKDQLMIPTMTKREVMLRYAPIWKAILFFCIPTVILMLTQGSYSILDKFLALQFATPTAIHNQEYIKSIIIGNDNFEYSILTNAFNSANLEDRWKVFQEFFQTSNLSDNQITTIKSLISNNTFSTDEANTLFLNFKDVLIINSDKMKQFINLTTQYTMQTYNIALSFTQLLAIGAGMHYAVEYGRRNREKLREIAGNGLVYSLIMSLIIGTLIFAVSYRSWGQVLILSQMGNERNLVIEALAWKDVTPLIFGIPLMFLAYFTMNMIRSEGKMIHIMIMTISSIPVNCLVSILAMKYGKIELTGAQLGTMIAFGYQFIYSLTVMFFSKTSYSKFRWQDLYKLKISNFFYSLKAGTPNFVIYFAVVINSYISTTLVIKLPESTAGPTIKQNGGASILQELLSAMSPWSEFILSACIGLNQGVRTMIAYNYGAQKNERIISILKRSTWLMFGWFMFIFILIASAGPYMMTAFNFPKEYISYGSTFYWYQFIYFMAYPFASLTYISLGLFQGVGRSLIAALTSSLRSLTFFIPLVLIGFFVSKGTNDPMWYFLIVGLTDFICAIVIIPIIYGFYKRSKEANKLISIEDNDITKVSYLKYQIDQENKQGLQQQLDFLSQKVVQENK